MKYNSKSKVGREGGRAQNWIKTAKGTGKRRMVVI